MFTRLARTSMCIGLYNLNEQVYHQLTIEKDYYILYFIFNRMIFTNLFFLTRIFTNLFEAILGEKK
jgi:hypothetical protein